MRRFLAGALASFLMLTGAFLLWQGRAADGPKLPPAPEKAPGPAMVFQKPVSAPEASSKSREEKRFDRADKNKDGKITLDEYSAPRLATFDKLDANHDSTLSPAERQIKRKR